MTSGRCGHATEQRRGRRRLEFDPPTLKYSPLIPAKAGIQSLLPLGLAFTRTSGNYSIAVDQTLAHRERRIVRPAERHARRHGLHRLEIGLALALVVARIDERHRPFDQLHDR